LKFLEESLVSLDVQVSSPEEAIQEVGNLLVKSDLVEESYVEAMLNSFRENGPYFVLAPKIALPHARPEDGVKESSVSLVRLQNPVRFGHSSNDPVQLVFGLGASSSEEHLQAIQKLTALLNDSNNVEMLLEVNSYNEIQTIIGGN
jgi:PTS system mannitol-specific IIA component/PTS system ascorbate-specific IIA component